MYSSSIFPLTYCLFLLLVNCRHVAAVWLLIIYVNSINAHTSM